MQMMTQEVIKRLPKLYSQEDNPDPIVVLKFFCPWTKWTWYAYEGEEVTYDDGTKDWKFFGWVDGDFPELGYFVLSELTAVSGPLGIKIERDMYWTPVPLSQVPGFK